SQATAHTLGVDLHVLGASTENEFDGVFASLHQLHAGGLVIGSDALFTARLEQLASLALRHAMPAVFQRREFAVAGGFASYGGGIYQGYPPAGTHFVRVFSG